MVACRNHGNALKDKWSSRSPSKSQTPLAETLVTSAAEVRFPRLADLIFSLANHSERCTHRGLAQPVVLSQFDFRFQPELSFATVTLNMNVDPGLFAGKEVEPEPAFLEDCRNHPQRLPLGSSEAFSERPNVGNK